MIRDSVREGSQPVGAREVFAHLNRSRTLFASNQFGKAFPELRLAYDKYLAFAAGHPRSREAMIMRSQLKAVTDSVLASCPARSDTIASRDRRAVLCAALAQAAAQATETGRAGGMPFLPMRRQPRGAVRPVP